MRQRRAPLSPGVRQAAIVEMLDDRGEVSVERLAARFSASHETIRRDLSALADAGRVRKVHGGARPMPVRDEGPFEERMSRNPQAKRVIAEKVAGLVPPGETLFMDTGSTTLACAEALAAVRDVTVITNSARIAAVLAAGPRKTSTFLLGGAYRSDNAQTVGPLAVEGVGRYCAGLAIITVGAVDASGIMDFSHEEAEVARAMIAASAKVMVVADHSKLDTRAAFRVAGWDDIDVFVCDRAPGEALAGTMAAAGVTCE